MPFNDFTGEYTPDVAVDYSNYTPDFPTASDAASNASVFDDFFSTARARLSSVLPSATSNTGAAGSQLFDAIYSGLSGRIDQARSKLVSSFLSTGEGKKLQANAVQQTIAKYAPYLILAAVLLIFSGVLLGRK